MKKVLISIAAAIFILSLFTLVGACSPDSELHEIEIDSKALSASTSPEPTPTQATASELTVSEFEKHAVYLYSPASAKDVRYNYIEGNICETVFNLDGYIYTAREGRGDALLGIKTKGIYPAESVCVDGKYIATCFNIYEAESGGSLAAWDYGDLHYCVYKTDENGNAVSFSTDDITSVQGSYIYALAEKPFQENRQES